MSKLWCLIDNRDFSNEGKIRVFVTLNCLIYCAVGFFIWLVASRFVLHIKTLEWAICFATYPGFFIGYIGGFVFLCRKS